jgi:hypothetical protein
MPAEGRQRAKYPGRTNTDRQASGLPTGGIDLLINDQMLWASASAFGGSPGSFAGSGVRLGVDLEHG